MDEQGAENGELAEENTETKGGTTRNQDVPGKAFNCENTGGEEDEVEAFRGRDPAAVEDWEARVTVEDKAGACQIRSNVPNDWLKITPTTLEQKWREGLT